MTGKKRHRQEAEKPPESAFKRAVEKWGQKGVGREEDAGGITHVGGKALMTTQ